MEVYEDEVKWFGSVEDLTSAAERSQAVKQLFKTGSWLNECINTVCEKFVGHELSSIRQWAKQGLGDLVYLEETGIMEATELSLYKFTNKSTVKTVDELLSSNTLQDQLLNAVSLGIYSSLLLHKGSTSAQKKWLEKVEGSVAYRS